MTGGSHSRLTPEAVASTGRAAVRGPGGSTCRFPSPHPTYAKSVEHRVDRDHREVAHESLGREHLSNGSRWVPGKRPARSASTTPISSSTKPCPAICPATSSAIASHHGSLPILNLVAISQADAALTTMSFDSSVIRVPRRAGKPVTVREPPQKRVGVQQQRHGYPPSHAASSSSCRGSKKASGTTIFPLRMSG